MHIHNRNEQAMVVHAQAKPIHLDIGGGPQADYFHTLARNNPDHCYLVLDPAITQPPRACPPNLQLIQWRSDNDYDARSQLPLKAHSVDTAHLNFLLGELHGRSVPAYADDPYYYTPAAELGRYRQLIHDLKATLKPGGRVHVSEPQANIRRVQALLEAAGFSIVHYPTRIADKHRTAWIEAFYHIVEQGGGAITASPALPMEVVSAL